MLGQRLRRKCGAVPVKHSDDEQRWATLLILLVSVVSVLSVGCPATIHYQPNDRRVSELGIPQAQQRLDEVLARSINPRITDVEITDNFLRYRYQQPVHGPYWIQIGSTIAENRIFFSNVGRVEVYENHFVFIWSSNGPILAQILFANDQDAKTFADLVLSFRAHNAHASRN